MGKRSNFTRRKEDAYDTPIEAVLPLLPHLPPATRFIEPCAGRGDLIAHLEQAGHKCVGAFDIKPRAERIIKGDALKFRAAKHYYASDMIITNPPWSRELLHAMIFNFYWQRPTWLLFDADWKHTEQAQPYLPMIRDTVSIGRVRWIEGTKHKGNDNCEWYYLDATGHKIGFQGRGMDVTTRKSGKNKHSYVPFYFDDWAGGTASMPRMVWSVYFQICMHNWDKAKPITPAHLSLITQDLAEAGPNIIAMLIDTGHIVDSPRGYYSERALAEGEKAYSLWEMKSLGGRKGGRGRSNEDSASTPAKTPSITHKAEPEVSDRTRQQNQNQNQNHIDDTVVSSSGGVGEIDHDVEADAEAVRLIEEAQAKSEAIALGMRNVAEAWNVMAAFTGLPSVERMTETRETKLRSLVGEFGADTICEKIKTIPDSAFLLGGGADGWRIKFDWLLDPDNFAKLKEGQYHDGREEAPAPPPAPAEPKEPIALADDPDNPRQVKLFRERLAQIVGDAAYANIFGDAVAVRITDGRLVDVYFRDDADRRLAEMSYEGAIIAASIYIKCAQRLRTLADYREPSENTNHIDTEENDTTSGTTEGKPVGE